MPRYFERMFAAVIHDPAGRTPSFSKRSAVDIRPQVPSPIAVADLMRRLPTTAPANAPPLPTAIARA
jgi:hypothetical protein